MNRPKTVIKALIIPDKYTADNIEAVLDRADITYEWVDLWQESYGSSHRLLSLPRDGAWTMTDPMMCSACGHDAHSTPCRTAVPSGPEDGEWCGCRSRQWEPDLGGLSGLKWEGVQE